MLPEQISLSPAFGVGATLTGMGITNFIDLWITTHRYTPASQSIGRKILRRFARETGDPEPDELTEDHIQRWWHSISANAAAASLRSYHSTVKCFLEWLHIPGLMGGIRKPGEPRSSPRVLSAGEVDRLRHACTNMRDRAIIELAWGIGLRCIEISQLQVADLDFDLHNMVIHSKGGHIDDLPLPDRVGLAIEAYYLECPPPPSGFVIRNHYHNNRGLTTLRISQHIAKIGYRAGVKEAAYDGRGAHGLRRTFATDLHDSGVPIRHIQKLMRHESLASTEKYLRRSTMDDMRQALEKREAAS